MGIRVNKIIGYGLKDIEYKNDRVIDKRINVEALKNRNEESFVDWIEKQDKSLLAYTISCLYKVDMKRLYFDLRLMGWRDKKRLLCQYNIFTYDDEFGLDNVMVIVPPDCKNWHRHDDIIDWIEESPEPRVVDLFQEGRAGIFPYQGNVIRNPFLKSESPYRSKKILDGGTYNQMVGRWDKNIGSVLKGDALEDLLTNWKPSLPSSIYAYLIFSNLLTHPKYAYDLTPLLYVYWA